MELRPHIVDTLAIIGREGAERVALLWHQLGYRSDKTLDLPSDPHTFWAMLAPHHLMGAPRAFVNRWNSAHFLFQLTNDEIPSLAHGQSALISGENPYQGGMFESFVFLAIELKGEAWSRTELSKIAREVNRALPMPVIIAFKHGGLLSIAVIDRRANKRDASKDVIDAKRISIIKDIRLKNPHAAHVRILEDLALFNPRQRHAPGSFSELYEAWMRALSVQELNKRFFDELLTWYLCAVRQTTWPKGQVNGATEKQRHSQASVAVIRLLTRLIFVWFVKEKGAIPDDLFDRVLLKEILKNSPADHPDDDGFYKAILQNLFFATLNTEQTERKWKSSGNGSSNQYLVHSLYRYQSHFKDPERALELFREIPFINGGLFECLDREVTEKDLKRSPSLKKNAAAEGKGLVLRTDGFSERPDNILDVPNRLFFSKVEGEDVELNEELGTKGKKRTLRGLIDILARYKFTVEENTPIEEEVALDPELLGKVFENLLASYNEDTKTSARKASGSFYTPREIVDYMVDESLLAYFDSILPNQEARLRQLLDFGSHEHGFDENEVAILAGAIENLKVLDPACGSGAFPMGMLQKLVHVLGKLDPDNERWKAQNRAPLEEQKRNPGRGMAPDRQEQRVAEAVEALARLEEDFADRHYTDYARKLYLIEKCLYGVDIQPIAVQIAKLRFFISLIVSQRIAPDKSNCNVTPLPNLETKLVAANALVRVRKAQQALRSEEVYQKEEEIRLANERHYAARTTKTKRKYRDLIGDLRDELAALLEADGMLSPPEAKRIVGWDPFDQNSRAEFFDPEWMFSFTDGFDVVFGNPPYIKEYTDRDAFDGLREGPYYQGKMDLWYIFACQALDLLKPRVGVLSFIATNNWVTNAGASNFRRVVAERARILRFVDFMEYKVFGSAAIQTMILVARNDSSPPSYEFELRRVIDPAATEEHMRQLVLGAADPALEYLKPTFERRKMREATFTFASDLREQVLNSIGKVDRLVLDGQAEVAQGIVAPQENVNRAAFEALHGRADIGEGIFCLREPELRALKLTTAELELIKPFFTTRELGRYVANPSNQLWMIYTGSEFKEKSRMSAYPNLRRHLDQFRDVITSDNGPYGLHRARLESFFEGEKIMSLRKCSEPTFTFTDFPCYVSQTFNVIKSGRIDLRYLTAVLNSSVVRFWLRYRGSIQGKNFQVDKAPLLQVPIFDASSEVQKVVAQYVRALIATAGAPAGQSASSKFDLLLNGLVLELYFPEDLKAAGIHLFDELGRLELTTLDPTDQARFVAEATRTADVIFKNDHPIYRMLFDLQAVPVVRVIEGKE